MKKDTAILISIIILSVFCYITDLLAKGGIIFFGTVLGIGTIAILGSAKPIKDLNDQESKILSIEKKFALIILPLIVINIFLFLPTIPEGTVTYKIILSITTICGFISLIGYVVGLIISIFPYQKMIYLNRFKRGIIYGLLSIQILVMIIYILALIQKK